MAGTDDKQMSEDEAYANFFFHFMRTLQILSKGAEQQSEELGHYNAAWELRDDFSRWSDEILHSNKAIISPDQREQVLQIIAVLRDIPPSVLKAAHSRPENVEALQKPSWSEVRFRARRLIPSFQSEMNRVNAILNLKGNSTQK